jgi:hypothetical protein
MSDETKPLDDQERVFLLARGDALFELVRQLRDNRKRELDMIETILKMMESYDQQHEQISSAALTKPGDRLINMMRMLKPKETEGKSDEEILKLVGGLNGRPATGS